MTIELRPFQHDAVAELLELFVKARNGYQAADIQSAIGLTATTGAGKTVIASAVIEAVLFGSERFGFDADPNAIFLWMTDLPQLNIQTQEKMVLAAPRLRFDMLPIVTNTFREETLSPGRVYLMNTQLLSKRGLLNREGPLLGRDFTFWDVITKTIRDGKERGQTLYLVVDEAHRGMTEADDIADANSIIQRFIKGYPEQDMPAVPVVWGISATPQRFLDLVDKTDRARFRWDVPPDQVRASGLIKEKTKAKFAGEKQTDPMALFPQAVAAWWKSTGEWQAYHEAHPDGGDLVIPAFVIQVENVSSDEISRTNLAALVKMITDVSGNLDDDAFVHAFGEKTDLKDVGGRTIRYLEPSKIAADREARVVFYKEALGTGWDCPRAEVLFSFRRALDVTQIGQTIGRMVRAPLARHIEDSDALNAAYVFLPNYDAAAVQAIINYLQASGNEAVAGTFEDTSTTMTLPLREGTEEALAALERTPNYIVPVSPSRSAIRFLAKMSRFLSSSGIDGPAKKREADAGAVILLEQHQALAKDAAFSREVDEHGEILIATAEALMGENQIKRGEPDRVDATDATIDYEFGVARSKLTPEVADAYVVRRIGEGTTIRQAKLEARAFASRPPVLSKLERWATERIDLLRQQHGAAVEGLSAVARARYFDGILQQAPDPTEVLMSLPKVADFRRGTEARPRHLYAEAGADPGFALGSSWETDTLDEALADLNTLAWLRNMERAHWALRIPRREGNEWRPFFPDFLAVRRDGDRVVVDILDPHDHTKPDSVSKAKGLSLYARRHAEKVGHVDLIAKISGTYRRLHLDREAIRKQVDALSDSGLKELHALFVREG